MPYWELTVIEDLPLAFLFYFLPKFPYSPVVSVQGICSELEDKVRAEE